MLKKYNLIHPIEIGNIEESSFESLVNNEYSKGKIVIIVDENSHDFCLEYLITTFEELKEAEVMLLPAGEDNKVMEVCYQVWEALSDYQVSRKDLVINLGGGLVTDMGGFIASVYKRGVDFIHVPTTLLGMVDASIGGKTGIDVGAFKNQIGTFCFPKNLFIDPRFLQTLPEEELLNGYAEMLKHALIQDKNYWHELTQIESLSDLMDLTLIEKSVLIKSHIVSIDPKESNERKKLNFGHTIGHGIEGYFLDKSPIPHGYAVGIGMIAEAYLSLDRGLINESEFVEIEGFLAPLFPKIELEESEIDEVIELILNDKKNSEGKIKCCLLTDIGSSIIDQVLTKDEVVKGLKRIIL